MMDMYFGFNSIQVKGHFRKRVVNKYMMVWAAERSYNLGINR